MRQDQRTKVAIVLVPGYYDPPEPRWPRDRLAAILAKASGSAPPRRVTAAGKDGLRLAIPGPPPFDLDLFELSWRAPRQSEIPFHLFVSAVCSMHYWMRGLLCSYLKGKVKDIKKEGWLRYIFLVTVHIPPLWRRSSRAAIQAAAMAGIG